MRLVASINRHLGEPAPAGLPAKGAALGDQLQVAGFRPMGTVHLLESQYPAADHTARQLADRRGSLERPHRLRARLGRLWLGIQRGWPSACREVEVVLVRVIVWSWRSWNPVCTDTTGGVPTDGSLCPSPTKQPKRALANTTRSPKSSLQHPWN